MSGLFLRNRFLIKQKWFCYWFLRSRFIDIETGILTLNTTKIVHILYVGIHGCKFMYHCISNTCIYLIYTCVSRTFRSNWLPLKLRYWFLTWEMGVFSVDTQGIVTTTLRAYLREDASNQPRLGDPGFQNEPFLIQRQHFRGDTIPNCPWRLTCFRKLP